MLNMRDEEGMKARSDLDLWQDVLRENEEMLQCLSSRSCLSLGTHGYSTTLIEMAF